MWTPQIQQWLAGAVVVITIVLMLRNALRGNPSCGGGCGCGHATKPDDPKPPRA